MKNRVDPEVEQAVLDCTFEQPAYGQLRVSNELKKRGIFVSPGGVRSIWMMHALQTYKGWLTALCEHHEYALYLDIENIDHTRTKVKSPQTADFS